MVSTKTLKLNDTDKITFNFIDIGIIIYISINETISQSSCDYDDFNNRLNELKLNLSINNHKCKQIRYWFYKNYKKVNPLNEYTTKYGRKINLNGNF